jgi:hypothetical protein
MRRWSLIVLSVLVALCVLLPSPAEAQTGCIVNVSCPWYVTPVYWIAIDLLYQGWSPLQIAQFGYANLPWIQAELGITEGEAFYAVTEVYWIIVPQFELMNPPRSPGGGDGGYSGDEGTN